MGEREFASRPGRGYGEGFAPPSPGGNGPGSGAVKRRQEQEQQPMKPGRERPEGPTQSGRSGACDQGHAARLARLKSEIRAGTYRADLKEIAKQLARAMEPGE